MVFQRLKFSSQRGLCQSVMEFERQEFSNESPSIENEEIPSAATLARALDCG